MLRLFMARAATYLTPNPEFALQLQHHEGNDDPPARTYRTNELGLAHPDFYKTFVKPRGTGHRKNHLEQGVCGVRLRRSANTWIVAMAWIDGLLAVFGEPRQLG
ncbi:MAG: hypothetical protein GXP34_00940 [Actinobacteria bacterium]|nr:hypothetical protein [Actinomycetota bacterium]